MSYTCPNCNQTFPNGATIPLNRNRKCINPSSCRIPFSYQSGFTEIAIHHKGKFYKLEDLANPDRRRLITIEELLKTARENGLP